jgi:AraC-like DNA-binding protein/nuclear transport factor 2 (NTF2) superfamily protein
LRAAKFVESYFDAWNDHDARLVADHLTADGTYCDIPDRQQHSRDELLATLTGFFASNNQRYELIGEILAGRDSIAFQYSVASSDALENTFFGAEFVTFDGRGAIRILDYYNMPGLVLPADNTRPVMSSASLQKYTRSGLSDAQVENYKSRLADLMHTERIFLEPDLTLPGLAALVGCSVNHLSQVINSGFGIGFFDYLNQHRVEYARQLLRRQDSRQQSILSIAFAAGFNSHSSFYTAFKKASGQTPAQYRRS